jgi:hypothetical protein
MRIMKGGANGQVATCHHPESTGRSSEGGLTILIMRLEVRTCRHEILPDLHPGQ